MQNLRNLRKGSTHQFISTSLNAKEMRKRHSPKVIQGITTGNIDELQKCHCSASARMHARVQKDFELCPDQYLVVRHINCFQKTAKRV